MNEKIALITGGSRGLGKSTVLHLAQKGTDVILTYHSKAEEARQVVAEVEKSGRKAVAFQLDTGDTRAFPDFTKQVKRALQERWGRDRFDFLVNNAGIGVHEAFSDTTEAQFDRVMNINLKGVFFLTQALLPLIADGGRIVNLSSGLARFTLPGHSRCSPATWPRNWENAESASTRSPPVLSRPISAAGWSGTTAR